MRMSDNVSPVNNAGGPTNSIDPWAYFDRFLMLGTFGTYYVSAKKQTNQAVERLRTLVHLNPFRYISRCYDLSTTGRTTKSEPIALALAVAYKELSQSGNHRALAVLESGFASIFRIGTHLFEWMECAKAVGCGEGRRFRRMVGRWYEKRTAEGKLDYQMAKYQNRNGWTHRDVLRLVHPVPSEEQQRLFRWATHGEDPMVGLPHALALIKDPSSNPIDVINSYGLTHEMVPNELKDRCDVWEALFNFMPYGAMLRNLNKMTEVGMVGSCEDSIAAAIVDPQLIKKSLIHPFKILLAWYTYARGAGLRGSKTWTPNPKIVRALETAFYTSFGNIPQTEDKYLLCLDISGSMMGEIAGSPIGSNIAEVAMAMATVRAAGPENVDVVLFSHDLIELDSRELHERKINDVWRSISQHPFGGTDCRLPILWALDNNKKYDAIVVYTDNEDWCRFGNTTLTLPQLEERYRKNINPDVKLIAVGFAATEWSILPEGPNNFNIAGLDADLPSIIANIVEMDTTNE